MKEDQNYLSNRIVRFHLEEDARSCLTQHLVMTLYDLHRSEFKDTANQLDGR